MALPLFLLLTPVVCCPYSRDTTGARTALYHEMTNASPVRIFSLSRILLTLSEAALANTTRRYVADSPVGIELLFVLR